MSEQKENLNRAKRRIAPAVVTFFQRRLVGARQFHTDELRDFVESEVGHVAPNSPYRIMYDLARDGVISYRVVSRSRSLYEAVSA